jgi:hypothetical protein
MKQTPFFNEFTQIGILIKQVLEEIKPISNE